MYQYFESEWMSRGVPPEAFNLLLAKGVFPYEYMNSIERFESEELPPIQSFYSNLKAEGISDHLESAILY